MAQSSGKILIVDDDEDIQKLVIASVAGTGLRCEGARNAAEAADKFEKGRHDVVFLDIGLPGANGFVVLKRLLAIAGGLPLPVKIFMLTAQGQKENVLRAVQEGAAGYMVKPVTPDQILQKVKSAFPSLKVQNPPR